MQSLFLKQFIKEEKESPLKPWQYMIMFLPLIPLLAAAFLFWGLGSAITLLALAVGSTVLYGELMLRLDAHKQRINN